MNPLIKLYIKTTLILGIPYAVCMSLHDLIQDNSFSWTRFFFLFFFFGLLTATVLVLIHKNRLKENGIEIFTDENLGVSQTKKLKSKISLDELISKITSDKVFSRMKFTKNQNSIKLKTGVSWRSWGETINVRVAESTDDFHYEITSSPRLKMTIIDYGKNFENIKKLSSFLV